MEKEIHSFGNLPITVTSLKSLNQTADVVFIHMSWGGAWAFDRYMRLFSEYGISSHAVDLRGHGKSGGTVEGATMQNYVDDVYTAVSGMRFKYKPVIIGHSMGGLVALMYGVQHEALAVVSMDGSPSLEAQKTSEEKQYKPVYGPTDAGMPTSMIKAMMALSDIYPWDLMKMKKMLGVESGVARSERKRGVSVPKESLKMPLLFIGAERGDSVPFGIGVEKVRIQAEYYESLLIEIKGATHPGLLVGRHSGQSAKAILDWLKQKSI